VDRRPDSTCRRACRIERHLAQIDLIQSSLKVVEADIAREAMSDPVIRRLMTLPGVDMTVASGVAAAVGDIRIAAVATARKLAMIIWHMLTKGTDYIWMRPALLARKFRSIELRAGLPSSHAKRGSAYDYNIPEKRAEERDLLPNLPSFIRRVCSSLQ
jgi:hypothetical protein